MKIIAEPIDVLVKFKNKQLPMPYNFNYVDQCGMSRKIKIDKIIEYQKIRRKGVDLEIIYRCQSEIECTEKIYDLKFITQECRWELFRM